MSLKNIKCISCNSQDIVEINSLYLCHECDLVFTYPREFTVKYDNVYAEKVFGYFPETWKIRLDIVRSFVSKGQILDIGYGNGEFLKLAQKNGFDIFGIDVHNIDYGIPPYDGLKKDIVTMFDVIEHLPNLYIYDEQIRQAELLIISTPLRPKSFPEDKNWKHFRPEQHLSWFSEKSLRYFLSKYQFNKFESSNVEDVTRGKLPDGNQNIITMACYI